MKNVRGFVEKYVNFKRVHGHENITRILENI